MAQDWLNWVMELQALAQAGLYYSPDPYDRERFQRIRELSVQMLADLGELPTERVNELFCCETGYQTPKLDTRAAVFREDQILLVQERDGLWALPGGWVDVNCTVKESAVKEVWEEAGLEVTADLVIALQDHRQRNQIPHAFRICKVFVLCSYVSGAFRPNLETLSSGYFPLENLPPLSVSKTTREQIQMCFDAYHSDHWVTQFD